MNGYYFDKKLNYVYRDTQSPPHSETNLHGHNVCELLFLESGDCELVLEGKRQMLFSGALVILPRGTGHFINILSDMPYRRHIVHFDDTDNSFDGAAVLDVSENSRIVSVFSRMRDYNSLFDGEQKTKVFCALLCELVLLIQNTVSKGGERGSEFMVRADEYIEKHIREIQNTKELCEALCISRAGLYREFEKAFGVSPMRYVAGRRLEMAQSLLRLGDDATKVCERVGFSDYSAFYRAYKAKFGYSPNKTKIL